MLEVFEPYLITIWSLLAIGGLLLVQLLVADIAGLVRGHVPGSVVAATHDSFHFRATRAHANTNESVAAFVVLTIGCMALGSESQWGRRVVSVLLRGTSRAYDLLLEWVVDPEVYLFWV